VGGPSLVVPATEHRADNAAPQCLGLTVGFVVVPQAMAYALLAKLPAEYGLYTTFVGFLLYWAFATSKDITIGVSPGLRLARMVPVAPHESRS
jgi:MFS superfamily sulfate permease-like transporter